LALVVSVPSRRVRVATAAAAVVPALLDRRDAGGEVGIDPVRWVALHALDQASYCAGVWRGAWRCRSARALLPRLSGIPGLTGRSGSGSSGG
jgi:hypothetical protein